MLELNWTLVTPDRNLGEIRPMGDHLHNLVNMTENKALVYGERDYGINLKWADARHTGNVRVQRGSGSDEPVTFDEVIAVNIRGGGFLKRQPREYGIGLAWGDVPYFEWKLVGGTPGSPVNSNAVIALFNTAADDYLFYDPRRYGINLKWVRDKGKYNDSWYAAAGKRVARAAAAYVEK